MKDPLSEYLLGHIIVQEVIEQYEIIMQQNFQEYYDKAKRLSETTTLTFQEALNQIIKKELK